MPQARLLPPLLRRLVWRGPVTALLLAAATLTGCGDAPSEPREAPSPATPGAAKGPDVGASDLLARLYRSVAIGPALGTSELSQDAGLLRELLWPDLSVAGAELAALSHMRAIHVAGSVAAQLAADPGARDGLARSDPFGLGLHDAWVKSAGAGLEPYKAWCAEEAGTLFRRREEELQRMFERPLR